MNVKFVALPVVLLLAALLLAAIVVTVVLLRRRRPDRGFDVKPVQPLGEEKREG